MMEEDFGRARSYRQSADSEEVLDTAIDTCPVDCISKNTWFELVTMELKRTEQVINPYANLFSGGGAGMVSSQSLTSNNWRQEEMVAAS